MPFAVSLVLGMGDVLVVVKHNDDLHSWSPQHRGTLTARIASGLKPKRNKVVQPPELEVSVSDASDKEGQTEPAKKKRQREAQVDKQARQVRKFFVSVGPQEGAQIQGSINDDASDAARCNAHSLQRQKLRECRLDSPHRREARLKEAQPLTSTAHGDVLLSPCVG